MIDYPNRITDVHVRDKIREIIDAINTVQPKIDANSEAIASLKPPLTLAQIQNALQLGGSNPINITGLLGYLQNPQSSVTTGTHATRLLTVATPGAFFWETDRTALYVGIPSGSTAVWRWTGGTNVATSVSMPVDLGVNDVGFNLVTSDTLTEYEWSGSAWNTVGGLYQIITNSTQNANTDILILQHLLTGIAGANGMGAGLLAQLVDSTKATVDGSRIETSVVDATAATFTTKLIIQLRSAGAALADWFAVLVTGIKFKVGGFFGIFTHANSADRTYTLPDITSTLVYETSAISTNLLVVGRSADSGIATLGTPGSEHAVLHGVTGGASPPTWAAIDLAADVSGVLLTANGGTGIAYNRIADTIVRTTQGADITTTNFNNVVTPGTYRVNYSLEDTASDITAGSVTLTIGFTDDAGSSTITVTQVLTGTGRTSGVNFIQAASGNVNWAVSHTGLFGSAKYSLYICFERLS